MPTAPPVRQNLDVAYCRSLFPALSRHEPWALLDNAGGSVTPQPVVERVTDHMGRLMVQLGASYPQSVDATARVAAGHAAVATLVGATPDEIILGASTTANLRMLAAALGLEAGDEVVVTDLDHEANIGGWRSLERQGVVIREWRCHPETLELEAETLQKLLGPRTKLVAFTHCSNIVGAFQQVKALTRLAHDAGARVCIDGVAYAPHRLIDVQDLEVDAYAFSLYKVFGPHLGALYLRSDLLEGTRNQNHFFLEEEGSYRLMPGNVSHELASAAPGILEYFDAVHEHHFPNTQRPIRERLSVVFELFAAHEERLAEIVLSALTGRSGVRVLGPVTPERELRAPTLSFVVQERDSSSIVPLLDEHQVAVRWGHFYAHRLMTARGLHERNGVIRASFAHYNTIDEAERLVEALDAVL